MSFRFVSKTVVNLLVDSGVYVFFSESILLPLSGVRPAVGGRAAPGADGARGHLPPNVFLPPAGRHRTGRSHKAVLHPGHAGRRADQGGGG